MKISRQYEEERIIYEEGIYNEELIMKKIWRQCNIRRI